MKGGKAPLNPTNASGEPQPRSSTVKKAHMVAQQTPRATRGSHLYQSSATQQHQSFKQSALGGQPPGSGKSERNQSMKQVGSASAEQHQQNSRKVTLAKQAQIHDNVKAGGAHSQLGLQHQHTM